MLIRRHILRILQNAAEFMMSSRLFSDYIKNSEGIRDFYPSHFKDECSWQKVMTEVSGTRRDYSKLAHILKRQNEELGSGEAATDNIDKLVSARSVFAVVTGQQVGVFTGPLYTIYKALTAIKLAQRLREKYGSEFIPVFWMESNDHDLQEANHINLLDSADELVKIEYIPETYVQNCSMKDIVVDSGFNDLILDLETRFPDTEFKSEIFHIIRESYSLSKNISYGFGRMMARILGKHGLVLLEPSDPEMKSLMGPVFQREIGSPLESIKTVNSAGETLRSRGYESQVEKSPDSTCLFMEEDGVRRKLFFQDGKFRIDGSDAARDTAELLSVLQSEPWRFSPNVALRPVIQDYMLPTAAYIAGPGEISYFAQLSGLYASMNVNMPIIYPRASFTIIESKVQRIVDKNGLDLQDLSEDYERLFSRLSKDIASEKLGDVLEASKSEISHVLERLALELTAFDPNMKNMVESTKRKIDHQINVLAEKAYKVQRTRDEILRDQMKRACMNIHPDGKPQERVFSIVQYLVLYGLQILDDIISAMEFG